MATSASAAAAAIASWIWIVRIRIRAAAATAGIASLYAASAACRWPHPHQAPPGRGLILRLRHLGDDADFAGRFAEVRATNFDSPGRSDGAAMGATTFARVASPGGSDGVEMQQVDEEVCEPCWSVIQPKIMPNSSK